MLKFCKKFYFMFAIIKVDKAFSIGRMLRPFLYETTKAGMQMNDHAKWEAVCHCDERCDGAFYYAVRTTGIFCRPSCKSRTPARGNVRFFQTREAAAAAGFRPCKRCRPDLIAYAPAQELAEQAKALIEQLYLERDTLHAALRGIGLSDGRLTELFKELFGLTPRAYCESLRLLEAQRLLAQTNEPVLDIALKSGFDSVSSFYASFKRGVNVAPGAYRKQHARNRAL